MKISIHFAALAAFLGLGFTSVTAVADDHVYTDGQVIMFTAIRTEYGKTDEYLKFLDTTWKIMQEAAKKDGYTTGYKVIAVSPRTENDPDIYLMVYYKNWAALDGAVAKGEALAKEVAGAIEASTAGDKGALERGKFRRLLGSWTAQELDLK
jgi:hypothetical protein